MADRPVECGQCKKPIKVIYKQIVADLTVTTEMCSSCPVLQQKLHGELYFTSSEKTENSTGLCCGNCRTTMEAIKMGSPVGCKECYEVFSDLLVSELFDTDNIPSRMDKALATKKSQPLHVGKSPTQSTHILPSSRLIALNEALNEALRRENYEQAAWLRDQIKALTEKPNQPPI
jgi:protein arginine kinase activator